MKKITILFMMVCSLIVFPGILQGQASIKEVTLYERAIQDPMKSWTITFTQPINKGTFKKQNFLIKDDKKRQVQAKLSLSKDEKKVTITPESPYKKGVTYYLYIKGNVKSGSNAFLNEHTVLPFKMGAASKESKNSSGKTAANSKQPASSSGKTASSGSDSKSSSNASTSTSSKTPGKNLVKVQTKKHSHFDEISVQVSDYVTKVKAGSDEFEYKGNNLFVLYQPGLKSGEKITVKGYSMSGKVLETKEVVIP
ncbi:Ig-like domain-containing protein [Cytobacillus praedii]|uniref:Ig-like domain-containing protein n=1 Tax=Cytobacillus praedii TaxID=1742358 RepID=UPI002E1D98FB|nr:Ig-like domain-containing protein [Cytobacillus praedii]